MTGWLAAALAEWPVSVQLVLEVVVVVGERLEWVFWLAACEIVVVLAGLAVLELVLHSEVAVAWPGLAVGVVAGCCGCCSGGWSLSACLRLSCCCVAAARLCLASACAFWAAASLLG